MVEGHQGLFAVGFGNDSGGVLETEVVLEDGGDEVREVAVAGVGGYVELPVVVDRVAVLDTISKLDISAAKQIILLVIILIPI